MEKPNTILNKKFLLKVSGLGYHTLAGWPLLVSLIGEEMAFMVLKAALLSIRDKFTVKMKSGLTLIFYSK